MVLGFIGRPVIVDQRIEDLLEAFPKAEVLPDRTLIFYRDVWYRSKAEAFQAMRLDLERMLLVRTLYRRLDTLLGLDGNHGVEG